MRGWLLAAAMLGGCDDGGADVEGAGASAQSGMADAGGAAGGGGAGGSGGAGGAVAIDGGFPDAQAPDAAAPDAAAPLPVDAPGPYRVSHREVTVTYAVPPDGAERRLRTAIWYPTHDEAQGPARYFNGLLRRPGVATNAAPVPGGPMPVLVFSHGNSAVAEQSFFLTEHFASHGWLVIAPDHTGNTLTDRGGPPPEIYYQRPLDLSAALDFVEALPDGDPLHGRAGGDVVIAGHSFGGYTVLASAGATYDSALVELYCRGQGAGSNLCLVFERPEIQALFDAGFRDPRVDAVIPLAPFANPTNVPGGLPAIDVPVLLVTAALDRTLPDAENGAPIWAALDGASDVRVDFATGGHFTFANVCDEFPGAVMGDGCGAGFLPAAEAHVATKTYALAFARRHLFADASVDAILDGDVVVHPDVRLSRR